MNITVSKSAGFCPGVKRATDAVENLISSRKAGNTIVTLGELIHNDIYNRSLNEKGVSAVNLNDIEPLLQNNETKKLTLVIRTHGIPLEVEESLNELSQKYRHLEILDMTCPFVKRIHKIASENTGDNTHFVLFGSKVHPESLGIISYAKGDKTIISSLDEAKDLNFNGKMPILCAQTTQNLLEFIKIKNFIKKLYTNAVFF